MFFSLKPTRNVRADALARKYDRTLRSRSSTIDAWRIPYTTSLGDLADTGIKVVDDVINSTKAQLAELRQAMTITTAASTAAAIAGVLLLFRTGRKLR